MPSFKKPAAIICDLEGTTTSVRFWAEVLSPFIKDNMKACLLSTWGNQETMDVIAVFRSLIEEQIKKGENLTPIANEYEAPKEEVIEGIMKNAFLQMQKHKRSSELRALQLLVWLYGYRTGLLKGHVYQDVLPAFTSWNNDYGIRIFIFASGLTIGQKLLFACSLSGNLTPYIEDYFDADIIGKKKLPESFKQIARRIKVNPGDILFLSDNLQELDAANEAGLNAALMVRTHNLKLLQKSLSYNRIQSFEEIEFS